MIYFFIFEKNNFLKNFYYTGNTTGIILVYNYSGIFVLKLNYLWVKLTSSVISQL